MKLLALDTATPLLVVGIVKRDATGAVEVLAQRCVDGGRNHNEMLVPFVREVLDEAGLAHDDLDGVVTGCGPGPFTGLRVGMATASAFADALSIPVWGVCSLDAIAHGIGESGRGIVATDARRREVYFAVYDDGVRVGEPGVIAPGKLRDAVDMEVSYLSIPAHLAPATGMTSRVVEGQLAPGSLVAVADVDEAPRPLVAQYLRRADAVPPQVAPLSPAVTTKAARA